MYELLLGAWLGPSIKRGTAIALAAFLATWLGVMLGLWFLGVSASNAVLSGFVMGAVAAIGAPRLLRRRHRAP